MSNVLKALLVLLLLGLAGSVAYLFVETDLPQRWMLEPETLVSALALAIALTAYLIWQQARLDDLRKDHRQERDRLQEEYQQSATKDLKSHRAALELLQARFDEKEQALRRSSLFGQAALGLSALWSQLKSFWQTFDATDRQSTDFSKRRLLLLASLSLTFVAGYTVLVGLAQSLPLLLALLAAVSVRGALLALSWNYSGAHDRALHRAFWPALLLVAAFFSYSGVFQAVYPEEVRQAEDLHEARSLRDGDARRLSAQARARLDTLEYGLLQELSQEYASITEKVNERVVFPQYRRLEEMTLQSEADSGSLAGVQEMLDMGYEYYVDSILLNFTSIKGERARRNVEMTQLAENVEAVRARMANFRNAYVRLTASKDSVNPGLFLVFRQTADNLIDYVNLEGKGKVTLPRRTAEFDRLSAEIERAESAREFFAWKRTAFDEAAFDDAEEARALLLAFYQRLPFRTAAEAEGLAGVPESVSSLGLNRAGLAYAYTQLFFRPSLYAWYSAGIALALELMIVFCGLLISSKATALNARNASELLRSAESDLPGLLNGVQANRPHKENTLARRVSDLLLLSRPNLQKGANEKSVEYLEFPIIIDERDLEGLDMSKEISLLISLKLAAPLPPTYKVSERSLTVLAQYFENAASVGKLKSILGEEFEEERAFILFLRQFGVLATDQQGNGELSGTEALISKVCRNPRIGLTPRFIYWLTEQAKQAGGDPSAIAGVNGIAPGHHHEPSERQTGQGVRYAS